MDIQKPRGTRDFPPAEMSERRFAEEKITAVFEASGYRKIMTPTFEHVELFSLKSGGEITEHMYVFEDKSQRQLCLRPEATASVCRMYAEMLRGSRLPLRLYYFSPMFRYERPQKGRYREFWQMGVELIGPQTPEADAETIALAYDSAKALGLRAQLEVGHVGVLRGLMADLGIAQETQDKATACIDKGDEEGLRKLVSDPTLLSLIKLKGREKIPEAEKLLSKSKAASQALQELKKVLGLLDILKIEYVVNLGIARGLEYYTGMVFEMRVPELAAQNQICGGGRYDNLIELFSGLKVPAVGFAFGFDRVMNALETQGKKTPADRTDAVVAPVSEAVRADALKLAAMLRPELSVEYDVMGRKLDKIRYAVIVGPEDLRENAATVRNMDDGTQEKVKMAELKKRLLELCR
jgi:histidyl-tRNA synthetase